MTKQEWHESMQEVVAILKIKCKGTGIRITGYNGNGIMWDVATTSICEYTEVKCNMDKLIEDVGFLVFSQYRDIDIKFANRTVSL